MRVLVVGIDGANIDLIKQWAQEGKLPTFKKLLSEGTFGNLESVVPTITIPAWNCMASGKNSGKIGVFSFIQKEFGTYDFRVYQLLNKKEECIWDILSDNGKTVQVINAPNVLYSYKINGIMIAGAICLSDDKLTYPESLKGELEKIGYKRDLGDIETLWSMSDTDLQTIHKGITDSQCKAWYHFMEQKWDFGFFVLTELDRVQHAFWNKKDVLLNHYQNVDKNVKELLTKIDKDTILLFTSDHGFGPNERTFLVNEWLKNHGLLTPKKVLAVDIWKNTLRIQKYPTMVSILRFAWGKLAFMRPLYLKISKDATRSPVDFTKTKAFSSATWGTIYINLKGREPQGIVPPEEYENLRTEIINELAKVPVKAYRCEELYKGEYMKTAPDIVIQIDHYVNSCSGTIGYGKEFRERFGGHHDKYNGTFIAWGPGIRKDHEVKGAHLYDIAPTILHIYGLPVKRDMDGRVLTDIFEGELAEREVQYQEIPEKLMIRNKVRQLKVLGKI